MQKVRLFAKCFKTYHNYPIQINLHFQLDYISKKFLKLPEQETKNAIKAGI